MISKNEKEILANFTKVIDEEIQSLVRSKSNISGEYIKAVRLLADSKKIIVTGVGKSGLIAAKIAATLSSLGSPALFMHPVDALHGDLGIAQKGDAALVLSKSGSTAELVALVPYIKASDIKIVSILGNTNSVIAEYSDVVIDGSVEREACPFNLAPTSSTTVALALGDALAIACALDKGFTHTDFSKLHPNGQLGRNLTLRVSDVMHSKEHLPLAQDSSTFREAIIEITLKGLGCVCIVNEMQELKGIITDGDIRRTLQKYEDLRGLTAKDAMTKNPISVPPNLFLGEALSIMENRPSQISVLPVVDTNNKCVGIIRIHDIVKREV